jgi:hypothetical protein
MPDPTKAHEREGEFDGGNTRHHLEEAPAAPGKATAGGAGAGPPGVVAGAAIGGPWGR